MRNGQIPRPDVHLLADVVVHLAVSVEIEGVPNRPLAEILEFQGALAGGIPAQGVDGK